jgi:hypothetical protein
MLYCATRECTVLRSELTLRTWNPSLVNLLYIRYIRASMSIVKISSFVVLAHELIVLTILVFLHK